MSAILIRLSILLLVLLLWAALLWAGRIFVARQRRLALAAEPLGGEIALRQGAANVRILAFSSATCTRCHTLQQPARRKLLARRGAEI
ncbi:MAG: hypothetical protein ACRDHW_06815, partial [Ktedonobacteraceae bacterium]